VTPAARVVPDVASFAVDKGFWYSIPEHLAPDLHLGSIVRIPLSGRRVRGWVVEIVDGREGNLKDIAAISGSAAVFDGKLLEGLAWTARHYVAPISTLLTRATPPNLPRHIPEPPSVSGFSPSDHPLRPVVDKSASGERSPVVGLVGNWRALTWLDAVGPVLEAGRSLLVVAASTAEVRLLHESAASDWSDCVVAVEGEDDKTDTAAWEAAQSAPRIVFGTPKTAAWHVSELALAIVLEEGRRAMKDRQTPTVHVREVLRTRSRLEGFNLVFFGPTPSVETLSAGAEIARVGNRAWPLIEVVDRSEEEPGSGYLSDRTLAAIGATGRAGGRVFVFTHRRVGHASMRCTRCRRLRACSQCGHRVARVESCPKCGASVGPCQRCDGTEFEEMGTIPERLVAELERRIGKGMAAVHPAEALITVGTERDLAGLAPVALAVAADVDGMLMGSGYRTTEEALRQLARLALAVGEGSGRRLMLQTSRPDSLLVTTLRRGDPIPYLERVLVERAREGAPPASEMIAVEIRGDVPASAGDDLGTLEGAIVLGPISLPDGRRWLLTGTLGTARLELRDLVGRWRDKGATVRIDADPIDV
jgi:primosomal protein N' (replication factor Y) (superfamily II helicase)